MSRRLNVYAEESECVVVHVGDKEIEILFTRGKNGVLYATVSNADGSLGATLPLVKQACVLDVIGAVLNVSDQLK